jgi:hypothetical protein
MSQWQAVQTSPAIRALYGVQFPIEIRHYFSSWIEGNGIYTTPLQLLSCSSFVGCLLLHVF